MTTVEYINTRNYRDRILAVLAAERGRLPAPLFNSFAAPLELELHRIDEALEAYEFPICASVVPFAGYNCCSSNQFRRLVPMLMVPQPNVHLNTPRRVSLQADFPSSGRYSIRGGWSSSESACPVISS